MRSLFSRFEHINVDIVGPLPESQGFRYHFTIVDRDTRWPEAIPITDTGTETCARALLFNCIARFGVPLHMTSDRGAQFTSEIWNALTAHLGIKTHHTTGYHPQANGLVERFHHTMKAALKASLRNQNWMDELPWILLCIRTAPKEDLRASSAELVYGYPLMVPGDFVSPDVDRHKCYPNSEKRSVNSYPPLPPITTQQRYRCLLLWQPSPDVEADLPETKKWIPWTCAEAAESRHKRQRFWGGVV